MKLYLLRHAEAFPLGHLGRQDDSERPLTPAGRKTSRQVAAGLRALKVKLDEVFTSPYLRARQTAEQVAAVLRLRTHLTVAAELAPPGDLKRLVARLHAAATGPEAAVLLVGHEPALSRMAARLLTGGEKLELDLKKAGLCRLEIGSLRAGHCAVLEWLLTPKQLLRMAD